MRAEVGSGICAPVPTQALVWGTFRAEPPSPLHPSISSIPEESGQGPPRTPPCPALWVPRVPPRAAPAPTAHPPAASCSPKLLTPPKRGCPSPSSSREFPREFPGDGGFAATPRSPPSHRPLLLGTMTGAPAGCDPAPGGHRGQGTEGTRCPSPRPNAMGMRQLLGASWGHRGEHTGADPAGKSRGDEGRDGSGVREG